VWPLRTFAETLARSSQQNLEEAPPPPPRHHQPEDANVGGQTIAKVLHTPPHAHDAAQVASLTAAFESVASVLPMDDAAKADLISEGMRWRELEAGEALFQQGDASDAVYVVLSGAVNISMRDPFSPLDAAAHQPTHGQSQHDPAVSPLTNLSFSPRSSLHADSPRSAFSSPRDASSHLTSPRTSLYLTTPRTSTYLTTPRTSTYLTTPRTSIYFTTPRTSTHLTSPRTSTHLESPSAAPHHPTTSTRGRALWQAASAKPVHVPPSHMLARVLGPGDLLGELVRARAPPLLSMLIFRLSIKPEFVPSSMVNGPSGSRS
jgi:CRP-like cAMP-binding protein